MFLLSKMFSIDLDCFAFLCRFKIYIWLGKLVNIKRFDCGHDKKSSRNFDFSAQFLFEY